MCDEKKSALLTNKDIKYFIENVSEVPWTEKLFKDQNIKN